jgi:hypothetical protein
VSFSTQLPNYIDEISEVTALSMMHDGWYCHHITDATSGPYAAAGPASPTFNCRQLGCLARHIYHILYCEQAYPLSKEMITML